MFVGLVAALRVFWPAFDYANMSGLSVLQVLGGLYIMVRGLDNVGKGLVGTRLGSRWDQLFRRDINAA